jgi:hypothetical protein
MTRTADAHHYFDERNQPLPEWDAVWSKLEAVFGSSTPERITMHRFAGSGGRFDGTSHTIRIAEQLDGAHLVEAIAHESAHLSMYQLTRGASATEPFRFFDEGYSDLVGKMIAGEDMADHKQSSLAIANREVTVKGLGFEKLQHWWDYAGKGPNQKKYYAYPAGSSFVYFAIDSFGENKLFDFFRDIGETRDLDASLRNIVGLTAVEAEQRWKQYVARDSALEPSLAITEMFPSNESSEIPVDIAELFVTFSVPMMRKKAMCVMAPGGNTGVSHKNAHWRDDRTLVITTDSKLLAGVTYRLELGSDKHDCHLMSATGAVLPATRWSFTTSKQT